MKNFRNDSITGIYESEGLSRISLHFNEWWNGEGMDFAFDEKSQPPISLHMEEIHAMMVSALVVGMVDIGSVMEDVAEMKQETKERNAAIEAIRSKYVGK
jgi:nucleoside diphosphate kinase